MSSDSPQMGQGHRVQLIRERRELTPGAGAGGPRKGLGGGGMLTGEQGLTGEPGADLAARCCPLPAPCTCVDYTCCEGEKVSMQ